MGQSAPDFTAESTHGTIHLAELLKESDQGVIVYFYPKASTPGCTKEACDFRDSLNSLKGVGYSVIGISADQMGPLERFADTQSLNFPLVSDPDHEILESWGAWGGEEELREDIYRHHPLDDRRRSCRHRHEGPVQRESHRSRREASTRTRH